MEKAVTVQALKQLLSKEDKRRLEFYREKIQQAYRNGYAQAGQQCHLKRSSATFLLMIGQKMQSLGSDQPLNKVKPINLI